MDFINNYYNLFPISYPNDCDTICEPRKKENKTKGQHEYNVDFFS